jgi:MFS family permease
MSLRDGVEVLGRVDNDPKDRLPRRALPWLIWGIGTAFVLFQFLLQLSSGVLVERLMRDFAMTAFSAGLMSGAYYYIYVALQTPAGMLIDRFGARLLLSVGGFICAAGCGLFAMSHEIWMADLGRLLMGGGSAFAFVGTLYLIANWFPAKHFGLMIGLSDFIATIATIGTNVFLATLIEQVSWRTSMAGAAVLAGLIGLFSWFIIRDHPENVPVVPPKNMSRFRQHAAWVLTNPKLWLNGIFIGILFAIVSVFCGMWGIPFISTIENVSTTQATVVTSMLFVGLAIGCPLIGWLYTPLRPHLRSVFVGIALLLCVLLSWIILLPPSSLVVFSAIMIVMGMISSVYVLSFTYVKEIVPVDVQTTSIGFTNALCVGTVPIFQPLVGYLLQVSADWRHGAVSVDVYDGVDYQIALAVLPLSLLIAAVLAWYIFAEDKVTDDIVAVPAQ